MTIPSKRSYCLIPTNHLFKKVCNIMNELPLVSLAAGYAVTEDVQPERRTRTVVSGDLIGVLETLFAAPTDETTQIGFHWYVRVRNPLFNLAGFFAAPVFRASHD